MTQILYVRGAARHSGTGPDVSGHRSVRLHGKLVFLCALIGVLFAGTSCRLADPTPEDLERVKEEFLILRFHAPFAREYSQMKDIELFEKSCVAKRVRCERVLEMLKEKDPAFYRKLMGAQDV